jgi:acyl carrier protein
MNHSIAAEPVRFAPDRGSQVLADPVLGQVVAELADVLRSRNLAVPPLGPETVLDHSLGLESLDFAELVVKLEQVFGKDPFSQAQIPEVKTIHDLAELYR